MMAPRERRFRSRTLTGDLPTSNKPYHFRGFDEPHHAPPAPSIWRRFWRPARRTPLWILLSLMIPFIFEVLWHRRQYAVRQPEHELDTPFYTSCQEPVVNGPRESAALVMLTRNSELEKANHTITSIEKHFNRWFHYPVVFLNDEPWDPEFISVLNNSVSGEARFEVIPQKEWTFPSSMSPAVARESIRLQGEKGISYGGLEGYHHMCRFYSGKFYMLDALKEFKWYWRLEPDVDFTCSITYDPFVEMKRHRKTYGFTISLWEEGNTCPSLFREMADWKERHKIPTSNLWKAAMQGSWWPWPFRRLLSFLPHHDKYGDFWSTCHYWSNFEIADMDFFRGKQYQQLFEYLDRKGGFYTERWGDAAVHSLAIAMLLDPRKVHHFEDIGYRHDLLYQCPANAAGGQLPESKVLGKGEWAAEVENGIGCRCECDGRKTRNHPGYCLNKLKQPNSRQRPWLTWLL